MLAKHEELLPVAYVKPLDRDMEMVAAIPKSNDKDEIIEELLSLLTTRAKKEKISGYTICTNVQVKDEDGLFDVIKIILEHEGERPLLCHVPYERDDDNEILLGDLIATEGKNMVFDP